MLFLTRRRLRHSWLLPLFVPVFAALASSCQSSRPSFSFQPAPQRPLSINKVTSAGTPQDSALAMRAAPPVPAHASRLERRQRRPRRLQGRSGLAKRVAAVAAIRRLARNSELTHRRPWLRRPRATAEVGLGTTVLGVLGLVLLPIVLIGLLLSGGGLVWAILAGAAALAVLVAYIDPFGK